MKVRTITGVLVLAALPVFAQGFQTGKVGPATDAKPGTAAVGCPAGARQVGGPTSMMEATGCVKFSRDGSRIFHGPYIAYWKDGVKQAEGQYEEGFRSGKWTFFNEKGVKDGETTFKMGDYDGLRIEFWPNGQKKLEETYVMGRRQGAQKQFDQVGKLVSTTEFVDDRPVAASK